MDKYSAPAPKRESYAKHRRDVNRQIILPIILVTLVGVGFAILAGFAASGKAAAVGMWADISIIWLIIPMMLFALVILALLLAMISGLSRLLKISPYYTGLVQIYALLLSTRVSQWTDKIIQPVLTIKTWLDLILRREDNNDQQKRD